MMRRGSEAESQSERVLYLTLAFFFGFDEVSPRLHDRCSSLVLLDERG